MLRLMAEAMRAGAVGLSTGLYYTPGSFAATDEVVALARVAAEYGGVYDTHMRDESAYSIGLLASVEETITIAEEAKIPVHISHLKALGREVWGQSGDVVELVNEARKRGLEVTANQYPYQASGTRFSAALIPGWVRADSTEAMFSRLENGDLKDRIREEMQTNLWRRGGPEAMLVTGTNSQWRGMTLADISASLKQDSLEAAITVVREGDPSIASFVMELPDIKAIALQEWVMTGSDGSEGHPRKYATYPKAYQDMVVGTKLFGLERFVYRSAGLVADTFNLCDRGYLQIGRKADVVVLDIDNYLPLANFENPTALASGVRHVLVNGIAVIREGEQTGHLPGEVIDRQWLSCAAGQQSKP
jgi:N-acyl-D-aspartate/D-glutamate deacylase